MTGFKGGLSAVQLGMETDLCIDLCEREKSPPLTKEKNISTWSLSCLCDGLFEMAAANR